MNQLITIDGTDGRPMHLAVSIKALDPGNSSSIRKPEEARSVQGGSAERSKEPMTDNQRQLIRRLLPKRFSDLSIRNLEMERIKWFGKADASRYITELLRA